MGYGIEIKSVRMPQQKCEKCQKTVYPTEIMNIDQISYHRWCFKCSHCNCRLTLNNYAMIESTPYCKAHFSQLFKSSGGRYDFEERRSVSSDKNKDIETQPIHDKKQDDRIKNDSKPNANVKTKDNQRKNESKTNDVKKETNVKSNRRNKRNARKGKRRPKSPGKKKQKKKIEEKKKKKKKKKKKS